MKISIVGCGYVGCVTGVCFADMGNEVTLVDVDSDKVDFINEGRSPIYEPGLEALMQKKSGTCPRDNESSGRHT